MKNHLMKYNVMRVADSFCGRILGFQILKGDFGPESFNTGKELDALSMMLFRCSFRRIFGLSPSLRPLGLNIQLSFFYQDISWSKTISIIGQISDLNPTSGRYLINEEVMSFLLIDMVGWSVTALPFFCCWLLELVVQF